MMIGCCYFVSCLSCERRRVNKFYKMGQSALCGLSHYCQRRNIVCAAPKYHLDELTNTKIFLKIFFQKLSGLHP